MGSAHFSVPSAVFALMKKWPVRTHGKCLVTAHRTMELGIVIVWQVQIRLVSVFQYIVFFTQHF
jgi:hypothetical protein